MSVLGPLPAAINISSAVIITRSPLVLSRAISSFLPFCLCLLLSLLLLLLLASSAEACQPVMLLSSITSLFVIIVMCLLSSRFASADISVSSLGRNCLFLPTIVTFDPMLEKKWPYSAAIYPPPTIAMLSGNLSIARIVSLVWYVISWRPFIGGIIGFEPVQRKIIFALIATLLLPTFKVYGSINSATS